MATSSPKSSPIVCQRKVVCKHGRINTRRKREGEVLLVSELPEKKTGHPLLLGEELDKQVQTYITSL